MISKSSGEKLSFTEFFKKKENIKIVYVVLIIGIILLSFNSFIPEKNNKVLEKSIDMIDYNMEKKLQSTLSEIAGVGNARVLITYKSKGEVVPAVNKDERAEKQREEGAVVRETESRENREDLVITGSGGSGSPFIVKELTPAVLGVIVIAEGGSDPKVKQNIIEAVTVLTGVSSHNVGVFPKKK